MSHLPELFRKISKIRFISLLLGDFVQVFIIYSVYNFTTNEHEIFLSEITHRGMKKYYGKAKRFLLSVKIL